ncbi:MAG: serine acetyltransferase [Prevotellaceae bacterium]|jgi:serine O-acetyltransferase|nr:serine acetyltransferase [Prevotellaceae bacterium]
MTIPFLEKITQSLSQNKIHEYSYIPQLNHPLPNIKRIKELMDLIKTVIFPGFFDNAAITNDAAISNLKFIYSLLNEQIYNGLCFSQDCDSPQKTAEQFTIAFIEKIPELKRLLAMDVKAVYDCDPAAKNYIEVIFCYPAVQALLHYRVAHELLLMQIPFVPRIISELAHITTGIEIHPGAQIGEYFSIDHGTGVVIGETCIIGNHVRLYQGVTLGAKGFIYDDNGLPLNVPRHPIIEDNVIIYSNSTILGRITIGHDSIIGGNVWQVHNVPPHSRITQKKATATFIDGLGI